MTVQTALQKVTQPISELPRPRQFPAMLEQFKSEIARALPKHLNADRLARIALTEFRKNPRLAECDPRSVFAAVVQASQLGLEPGLMGQAYLIPYKTECQLIPGYQGLIDLVRRTGRVKRIEAHVVRDGDVFRYRTGLATVLDHEPKLDGEPGDLRLAYAVAELVDGGYHVEVMTRTQIETIRDRSQNVQRAKRAGKLTPWDTDTEEMWRKTVLRRICKYLPKSAELATALALEGAAERGPQRLDVQEALEGSWAPVPVEDEPEVTAVESIPDAVSSLPTGESEPRVERVQEWPRQFTDAETGEVGWNDSAGDFFDPMRHALSKNGVPSVNTDGTFRNRRGSAQTQRPAKVADPEFPPADAPTSAPAAGDPFGSLE